MSRTAALTQYANGYSLRTARYRYSEWGEDGMLGSELYDHQTDPAEMVNLANRNGQEATVSKLSTLLRERIESARTKPDGLEQIIFENRRRVR